jgi:uncharacterized protein DUF4410
MSHGRCLPSLVLIVGIMLSGCGAVSHDTKLAPNYVPQARTLIEVGRVTNATGQVPKVDDKSLEIERMLATALTEKLKKDEFLWTEGTGSRLVLTTQIVEYEPGDAFKRWLLPGWGSTVVAVEADLRDADQVVGTLKARRTVSFGGVYTIGAWRTIFEDLAGDIMKELRSKIPKR